MRFLSLDGFQKLRALRNGVIVGINHLELDAKFVSGFFGRMRLFDLIIVVVRGKRNEKTQLFHIRLRPGRDCES